MTSRPLCVLWHKPEADGTTRPRVAKDGLACCYGCYERLTRDLRDLQTLDADLVLAHGLKGPEHERTSGGEVEAALPIQEHIAELRTEIAATLACWAKVVVDEHNIRPPDSTYVPTLAAFLLIHIDWVASQPFVVDYDREVRSLRGRAFGKAFPIHRRQFPVGVCPIVDIADDGDTAPCIGTVFAVLHDADSLLPASLKCDYDPEHLWAADQWLRLGRMIHRLEEAG